MIAVEFYDPDVPLNPKAAPPYSERWRTGTLLQIARGANMNDNTYVAFIIATKMEHDKGMAKTNDKIVLPVLLTYVRVKGTSIPLFGS